MENMDTTTGAAPSQEVNNFYPDKKNELLNIGLDPNLQVSHK